MSTASLHEINAKKHKLKAGVLTAIITVCILVLCFTLTAFTIPDPPPGEQFVSIGIADLGDLEDAGGETETEVPSEVVEEVVEEAESVETIEEPFVAEEVVTQEVSDVSVPDEVKEEVVEKVVEEKPKISIGAALVSNNAASGGGGSQGETQGIGDQGDEDGKIEGSGVVTGDFGSAYLDGAGMLSPPSLNEKPAEEGLIRMKIVVNSEGKVISAAYDAVNSTSGDTELIRLSKIAAKSTLWETSSKPRRSGYMDFRFELE